MSKMIKILFICHGNICRSPMAEFVMKDLVARAGLADKFYIGSAATSREEIGNDIHRGTKEQLRKHGVAFSTRGAVQLCRADLDEYDYLIGMDTANIRNMNRIVGSDTAGKIYKLPSFAGLSKDIADPWYTGNFDETYDDVVEGCEAFLEFLKDRGEI